MRNRRKVLNRLRVHAVGIDARISVSDTNLQIKVSSEDEPVALSDYIPLFGQNFYNARDLKSGSRRRELYEAFPEDRDAANLHFASDLQFRDA